MKACSHVETIRYAAMKSRINMEKSRYAAIKVPSPVAGKRSTTMKARLAAANSGPGRRCMWSVGNIHGSTSQLPAIAEEGDFKNK